VDIEKAALMFSNRRDSVSWSSEGAQAFRERLCMVQIFLELAKNMTVPETQSRLWQQK